MFHLKSKPRPPLAVDRVTPGQVVELLGDGQDARLARVQRVVDLAEQGDRLEILLAAVDVRHPPARLSRVVEVEHRGHGVDAQPVDVEFLRPVVGVGDEEVAHLVACVVEDVRSPIGLLAAARVGVLVERRPVEPRERPSVAWEVGGHPVEDHTDAAAVHDVNEMAEIVGGAVPRGRGVIPGDLVSPRSAEGVLHDREQLHVREPHGAAVGGEGLGDLAVAEDAPIGTATPRAQVDLVGSERGLLEARGGAPAHPRPVPPTVDALLDDAGGPGRMIRRSRQGIGLEDAHPVAARDQELVANAGADPRAEQLPHPRAAEGAHRPGARIPEVGVAHHADPERIWRPDAECGAEDAFVLDDARAENPPELGVRSFADQVEVQLAEGWREPVWILLLPLALRVAEADAITAFAGGNIGLEQSRGIYPAHRREAVRSGDACGGRFRMERPDPHRIAGGAGSQQLVRISEAAGEHLLHGRFELGPARVASGHWPAPRSRNRSGIGTQDGR